MARPTRSRNRRVLHRLGAFARDRRGATAIEYGLILALVTLTMMGALAGVAEVTTNMWSNVSTKVANAR